MSRLGLLIILTGAILLLSAPVSHASSRWDDDRHPDHSHGRAEGHQKDGRGHGNVRLANPPPPPIRYDLDRHWRHDRYYPRHGEAYRVLPSGSVSVVFGGLNFFFQSGVWMRPHDGHFRVVAPPIGIVVPMLPTMAVTLRQGGATLFYANGTYYQAHRHGGYVVVPAPAVSTVVIESQPVVVSTLPAVKAPPEPIIYPRNGQSPEAQEADLQACNRWATSVPAAMAEAEAFQRAVSACMDGRGYTVR